MKRVLLTGGTGFVGANLARRLLREGHELHLLVRPNHARWRIEEVEEHIRLHTADLSQKPLIEKIVKKIKPDWVFHLAAHGAYAFQDDPFKIVETNFMGTMNLIQACIDAGFEAFINTGSSSEYGFKSKAASERDWLEPNSHYAVAKAAATLYCRYEAQSKKLPITTLRLYSVYGPYEDPRRLIPTLILKALSGRLPPLVHPDISRDFVFTEDVSEAYIAAAASAGKEFGAVYNVGSGVKTTIGQLVSWVGRELKVRQSPVWGSMPDRKWDTQVWVANNRKITKDLKWTPRYSLRKGLRETVDWFRSHDGLSRFYRIEQNKAHHTRCAP